MRHFFQTIKIILSRNVGNGESGSEKKKFKHLKERILKEKDTLFYIVIDEGKTKKYTYTCIFVYILKQILANLYLSLAHFAPINKKQIDNLINDKDVLEANNTIILQVSATPYNLVTKNTRLV